MTQASGVEAAENALMVRRKERPFATDFIITPRIFGAARILSGVALVCLRHVVHVVIDA